MTFTAALSRLAHGTAECFRSLGQALRHPFGDSEEGEWEQWPADGRADHEDGDGVDPLPLYRRWSIDALCPPPRYAERPTGPPPTYWESLRQHIQGGPTPDDAAAAAAPEHYTPYQGGGRRRKPCRPLPRRRRDKSAAVAPDYPPRPRPRPRVCPSSPP